jgi:hypothetical protein
MFAETFPLQVLLLTFSGLVNRHQADIIAYLVEENRVLPTIQPVVELRAARPPFRSRRRRSGGGGVAEAEWRRQGAAPLENPTCRRAELPQIILSTSYHSLCLAPEAGVPPATWVLRESRVPL